LSSIFFFSINNLKIQYISISNPPYFYKKIVQIANQLFLILLLILINAFIQSPIHRIFPALQNNFSEKSIKIRQKQWLKFMQFFNRLFKGIVL